MLDYHGVTIKTFSIYSLALFDQINVTVTYAHSGQTYKRTYQVKNSKLGKQVSHRPGVQPLPFVSHTSPSLLRRPFGHDPKRWRGTYGFIALCFCPASGLTLRRCPLGSSFEVDRQIEAIDG